MKKQDLVCLAASFMMIWSVPSGISAQEHPLTATDKKTLLVLARQTLVRYLTDGSLPAVDESQLSQSLLDKGACFVTLNKRGTGLRGCIGIFQRVEPLYRTVMGRAVAAATKDFRFPTVRLEELPDIKLDISVLTEPKGLEFTTAESLLEKLRPLKDGVILTTQYGSSTFLPQVWEQLPDKEQFLYHLCRKHGAPGMIWKEAPESIQIQTYQAIVFGEDEYGGTEPVGK